MHFTNTLAFMAMLSVLIRLPYLISRCLLSWFSPETLPLVITEHKAAANH